ncbi:MAG: pyridoxal-phosphate dependent enzyme [Bacteroidota bacterium]|nr:pyridoxal-phosphate dependent enzyme [Bacteroidota bacterium]
MNLIAELNNVVQSKVERLYFEEFGSDVEVYIKREDLLHPYISGNKYRKLKYNLIEAYNKGYTQLLTFGGAFSNHIHATAYAAQMYGFKLIVVVRGEELENQIANNPTLQFVANQGGVIKFVDRETYRNKNDIQFINKLRNKYGDFYLIPEGGTNELAIRGCQEILTPEDKKFDYLCTAVGTGGTISGVINTARQHQKVIGVSVLKGDFLNNEIKKLTSKGNWELLTEYHFGGYAKINEELVAFINKFYKQTQIRIDPVYVGKLCYAVMNQINKGYFEKGTKIMLIHTGGLQGIEGINNKLKQKGKTLINV